jgi:hypothetical protein
MADRGIDIPVTLIFEGNPAKVSRAQVQDDDIWLPLENLAAATAWELKPEGVCQGGNVCSSLRIAEGCHASRYQASTWFNFTAFARLIEEPVAVDQDARIWHFGPPGWEWKSRSTGKTAPEFTARDLAGHQHSLRELGGKKVLLLFWASW